MISYLSPLLRAGALGVLLIMAGATGLAAFSHGSFEDDCEHQLRNAQDDYYGEVSFCLFTAQSLDEARMCAVF